jgi:hypothetical protein
LFRFNAKICLIFFSLLPVTGTVYAEPDINFFEKTEIVQRMDWPAADDVLKYGLVIEKRNEASSGNVYIRVLDIETETNSVELSLPPGEYRYRITVYDLLGRGRSAQSWAKLTIFQAFKPEISSVKPSSASLQDALSGITLSISGNNLVKNGEVFFSPADSGTEKIKLDQDNYRPDEDGKGAKLILDGLPLKEGAYDIVIKNPGGISAVWRNFTVTVPRQEETRAPAKESPFEMMSAAGYAPLFSVSGDFTALVGNIPFLGGAMLRLGINTKNKRYGIFGVETEAYWHHLSGGNGQFTMTGHLINAQLNLLYQKRLFRERAAVNVRLGGGFAYFVDMQLRSNANIFMLNTEILTPMASASLSATWFFLPPLFLEFGAAYMHVFSSDTFQPAYIRPVFCLGFRL